VPYAHVPPTALPLALPEGCVYVQLSTARVHERGAEDLGEDGEDDGHEPHRGPDLRLTDAFSDKWYFFVKVKLVDITPNTEKFGLVIPRRTC
jgi:hypothetical protein